MPDGPSDNPNGCTAGGNLSGTRAELRRLEKDLVGSPEDKIAYLGGYHTARDIPRLRSASGEYGAVMRGVWGWSQDDLDREIEERHREEVRTRPYAFVNKWGRGSTLKPSPYFDGGDGFWQRPRLAGYLAEHTLIDEATFSDIVSAAEFAIHWDTPLDMSITISPRLLGLHSLPEIQDNWRRFMACRRDWLAQRRIPDVYVFAHEYSPRLGLHHHLATFLPADVSYGPSVRAEFLDWVKAWVKRRFGEPKPKAIRVRGGRKHCLFRARLLPHYLLKGYDYRVVVRERGDDLMGLGDLIAFGFRPPGRVEMEPRAGVSRSLSAEVRKVGVPTYHLPIFEPSPTDWSGFRVEAPPPEYCSPANRRIFFYPERPVRSFRSRYEQGYRDVRSLYGEEFVTRINRTWVARQPETESGPPKVSEETRIARESAETLGSLIW